ncbi:MAG TPA: amino acid adenylation domain-containing protein [Gemmatimonadaceae bacterium]|nr:amino acid adenylation domain-containing protein [Gemmatimonadaceae bacterium]
MTKTTAFDTLATRFAAAATRWPGRTAVEDPPTGAVTYAELDALSDRVRDRLIANGVRRGDRVGVYMRKSIDAVAALLGAMKAGAAYVPVDASAPAWRSAYILHDCAVGLTFIDRELLEAWGAELDKLGDRPPSIALDGAGDGRALRAALDILDAEQGTAPRGEVRGEIDDLAYILYTSGSTGKPKGVMLSHRNALTFVDWCAAEMAPVASDRFSSHAPFHFDLSILDLYLPLTHGATMVLIGADVGKAPVALAALIAERMLTVWYSTPSILTMLVQYGKLSRHDLSSLRLVLFAGEVFPVKHLRALQQAVPAPRYLNLYGPTETNVCTWYEVAERIPDERTEPYPIGRVCPPLRARVVDIDGTDVAVGEEGELCIAGPGVMHGYWNLPERTAQAFLPDSGVEQWYRTGDLVVDDGFGSYTFVGRRDRMVKRRGYRIELGEIEAGLYRHECVEEAAVIALHDGEGNVRIKAFLRCVGGTPSVIELKQFCADALPTYMVPDAFEIRDALPKTTTDKIDYQRLQEIA